MALNGLFCADVPLRNCSLTHSSLWKMLTYYGIPDGFINIFKALYDNSSCCVKIASGYTEFFEIVSGVWQGCIFSPFRFIIVVDFVMRRTMDKLEYGIVLSEAEPLNGFGLCSQSSQRADSLTIRVKYWWHDLCQIESDYKRWSSVILGCWEVQNFIWIEFLMDSANDCCAVLLFHCVIGCWTMMHACIRLKM